MTTPPARLVQRRLEALQRLGPAQLRLLQLRLNGKPIAPRSNREHKKIEQRPEQPPNQLEVE